MKNIFIDINGEPGKYCRSCYYWKPLTEFSQYKSINGYKIEIRYTERCKSCISSKKPKYQKKL